MFSSFSPAEQQIANTLQAGHTLTVRWDCGGDESFVYTAVDGQELDADYGNDQDLAYLLDGYLTERLNLPDAGDFTMEGTGRIFREGAAVILEYQSRAVVGWDEFSDEELAAMGVERPASEEEYAQEPGGQLGQRMSDKYSGRSVLFTMP